MRNIVFATNNKNKLVEVQDILEKEFIVLSLKDINCLEELKETHDTLEDNASEKAFYIFDKYSMNCFADDSGLEIEALKGKPGVLSARYAGDKKCSSDNIKKVLKEMQGKPNRKAKFRTVISLIINGGEKQFEGFIILL